MILTDLLVCDVAVFDQVSTPLTPATGSMFLLAAPDMLDVYFSVHRVDHIGSIESEPEVNTRAWAPLFSPIVERLNSNPEKAERTLVSLTVSCLSVWVDRE